MIYPLRSILKTPQINSIFSQRLTVSVLFQARISRSRLLCMLILLIRPREFGLFNGEDDSPSPGTKGLIEGPPVGSAEPCPRSSNPFESEMGADLI
jgi:hypothetical protein